ncbi:MULTISPECIES: acetoacetate decarboxylase family protein [Metallosphaera]|uniref:acetoacetate decarboxylase family protein n=2 Tax=Sulfolobaceae TaxID=118883 RepID=UPI001F06223B|nr:acetoacetate decarboxylase family protein [Metallosphaera sedula]MCH1771491.1 acetoacetate decarboxylase family protein [Metallosphaera sedula]MCP6728607.1 acetoacetate decarboxylase family protein [Metallosphaera sedula]BBL46983.1 acetoacetate decarboxylase [Metallosphaera sedula]
MSSEKDFTMPITRTGRSQTVFPPPWYYGVTYIASHVKFSGAEQIIPEFMKTDGEGWVYIAEFVSTAESNWDYMYQEPDLVQYMEGAIGLKVEYKGKNYLYFPYMWVDKDWALVRGWLDGYPKKIANIRMTKLHPLLPKYNRPETGLKMGGYVTRGGGVMLRLRVELEEKTDSLPLKNFGPFINVRRFASRGEGEDDVYEIVSRLRDESRYGEIWKGTAEVELGGYVNDEVNVISVDQIYGGYYYTLYFRVTKTVLLDKVRGQLERVA